MNGPVPGDGAGTARGRAVSPAHEVVLQPSGWRFACRPDASILEEAARAGIRLPSSCRNGTCRTCLCRLLRGQVEHAVPWPGLSADEKAEGWILPCVARARSDLLIDAPKAAVLEKKEAAPLPLTGARRD
jgi:ferredoxin